MIPTQVEIFNDVFEAIRHFEPYSPLLNLGENKLGFLQRNIIFNAMEMPNGKISAFPQNMLFDFFRGENDDYDTNYPCVPSIYRSINEERIIIDELKVLDFVMVAKTFPQVKFAERDFADVDFLALAQHYELNTSLIDVSSDIGVAAFFATNMRNPRTKIYEVKNDGLGCIRKFLNPLTDTDFDKFRMIGLQPFQRPGIQCAFAVKMQKGENFAANTSKVLFYQNEDMNKKLHDAFCFQGQNILFPDEDICQVADLIKSSNKVTKEALSIYSQQQPIDYRELRRVLKNNNFEIVDKPLFKLSRQQTRMLERTYKNKPYGNVTIRSRLAI